MSETSSAVAVGREVTPSSPGSPPAHATPAPSSNGRGPARHVLPFEQPLAKLEEQIQERPYRAVLLAAGLGLMLGLVLHRR